ncbi:MAG: AmmeMemoRadiSam system protein B [Candidatus Omnitrophica bacterium]|nr:AmmeMemoRadiSam system protein B [Candidatus Omnitrophota bacterium]
MNPQTKTRPAAVSGQFYPDIPEALRDQVRQLLAQARSLADPRARGLIVPHAGYDYSGRVAAEAYKTVRGRKFECVVIIAFLHRCFLPGVLVDDVAFYETPLGRVPVEGTLARKIREFHPLLRGEFSGRLDEHSLEVQIPFLQEVIPDLRIVPVFLGEQTLQNIRVLAAALAQVTAGRDVLTVATSDLSHFHPYETAVRKDKRLIALFEKADLEALGDACARDEIEACGLGPMLTLALLAKDRGWTGPSLIRYENSGDVTGERNSVVGYAAMVFREANVLGVKEKTVILDHIHQVLRAALRDKPPPVLDLKAEVLDEKRGIFVTLKKEKMLRGCIGHIVGQRPLRESIGEMALAAAFEDPRFPPVGPNEVDSLKVHVSFLTVPVPVRSYRDIRLGLDGIIVSYRGKKGVYLPEVATETGWDQEAFFRSCALEKAGLDESELAEASIEVFQTEGFGDEEKTGAAQ